MSFASTPPSRHWLVHTTAAGERWDSIAWHYWGDALGYEMLIADNPHVPITPVLPGGTQLRVRILDAPSAPTLELPPWKR